MKKLLSVCCAVLTTGVAFASADDTLIAFSTPGPDKYANDGTTVRDGECYALVFTPNGKTFSGFAANGEPVDPSSGVVAIVAPLAKGGRCPSVLFQVDADFVTTKCSKNNGTWSVWLLDTRRVADGLPAGTQDGKPVLVNAAGEVTSNVSASSGGVKGDATSKIAASVDTVTAAPVDAPMPVVTDIRVDDQWAYVTMTGTVSYLSYNLASGDTPESTSGATAQEPVQGADRASDEILLIKPRREQGEFLRATRHPWKK